MEIFNMIKTFLMDQGLLILGVIIAIAMTTIIKKIFGKYIKQYIRKKAVYNLIKLGICAVVCAVTILPFFFYKKDLRITIYIINTLTAFVLSTFLYMILKMIDGVLQNINPKWTFIQILVKELEDEN